MLFSFAAVITEQKTLFAPHYSDFPGRPVHTTRQKSDISASTQNPQMDLPNTSRGDLIAAGTMCSSHTREEGCSMDTFLAIELFLNLVDSGFTEEAAIDLLDNREYRVRSF